MTSDRFVTIVIALGAVFFLAAGIWAFAAPQSFYGEVATFPPYNRHFIHDIGAFQIGIGVVLLFALTGKDPRFVALCWRDRGNQRSSHLARHRP